MLNLNWDIKNVRELIIMSEFSIINCLPIPIKIKINNNIYEIKKCHQFYLDFTTIGKFYFYINALNHQFNSNYDFWFSKEKEIKFYDNNGYSFYLSLINLYHSKGKQLIIYAETLIKNNCGISDLDIYSYTKENKPFIFNLDGKIFVVSSKMDLKDNMRLINGGFKSDKVKMENLISSSNNLSVKMNYEEYSLEL